jgi:hypothetical protein
MRSKQIAEDPKTFVVILDTGDEILLSLKSVARTERLAGSNFKAIGALSDVELGWLNWETKKYRSQRQSARKFWTPRQHRPPNSWSPTACTSSPQKCRKEAEEVIAGRRARLSTAKRTTSRMKASNSTEV